MDSARARRPKWHHLYFALGALDLITVGVGLWLSHSLSASYRAAVTESQAHSALMSEVMELGALAQAVNAPGNDVFETRDVAAERARRDAALERFDEHLAQLLQNTSARSIEHRAASVADALGRAYAAMDDMTGEADTIFRHFERGRPAAAGQHMASMDRKFAELSEAIAAGAAVVQAHQQESLELQSREAESLQTIERVIALLMLFMVAGVTFYGHRVAKLAKQAERTEEELSAALREVAAFFDVSADALLILDRDARITRGNATAETLFGLAGADLVGKYLPALQDGEDGHRMDAAFATLHEASAIELFCKVPAAAGQRHVHWRFMRRGGALFGAATDVTQRIETDLALKSALEEAKLALANASAYQDALDQQAIVAMTDLRGRIIFANDLFCELSGYGREELMGQNHRMLNSGAHGKEFFLEMWCTIASGGVWHGEVCNKTKSGEFYWVDTTIVPQFGPTGRPQKYISVRYDITPRKRAEAAAERRQKVAAIIADMQGELIASGSMHFSLHRALSSLLPMYEASAAVICELGRDDAGDATASMLAHVKAEAAAPITASADLNLQDAAFQPDIVRECLAAGQLFGGFNAAQLGAERFVGLPIVFGGGPIGMLALAGSSVSGNATAEELQPLLTAFGDLLLAQRDVERRRLAEEQARTLARHDALTGLGNRRFMDEEFEYRTDHPDAKFGLILIDLDRFKPINDAHGHLAGDCVLKIVAQRLRGAARGDCAIARLGGDEFAILTEPDCHGQGVRELAERVLNVLLEPMAVNELTLTVGASIGVSMYPADAEAAQDLLHLADAAMYRAKERRGDVQFFDASMDEGLRLKAELESELRAAIEADEIVPFFQPIVSLQSEAVVGHEVLARWRHKSRGFISPAVFIPIAEDAGLIDQIFWRLLRAACAEHSRVGADTTLSINLSPVQIKDALFAQRLIQALTEIGFPAQRLEVEVTESAMLGDIERARAMLVSLRNQGVRIALDDFGTGYSSLLMLRDLPIDKVKIDQSFIRGLANSSDNDCAIIDAILGMAAAMKLAVTAEGIENAEVAERLRARGELLGQGYHFGRPEPTLVLSLAGDEAEWRAVAS